MNSPQPWSRAVLVAACAGVALATGAVAAKEEPVRLERLIPDDVIAYARFVDLPRKVEAVLESGLREKIASSALVESLLGDRDLEEGWRKVRELEAKAGLDLASVLGEIFRREVAIGVFLDFSGIQGLVLARFGDGEKARTMVRRLKDAAAEATGKPMQGTLSAYEGETIETLESVSVAVIGDVLAIANQTGVLESVIDLAAGRAVGSVLESEAYGSVAGAGRAPVQLALRPNFLPAVRVPRKLDSVASLLFGGWLAALHGSELLAIDLDLDPSGLVLTGSSLVGASTPREEFRPWFPPAASPSVVKTLREGRDLAVVEIHRDLAAWWRNRERYVVARAVPKLEVFAQYMSVVFGGSSFEREVLGEIGSPITLVARRQRYPGATPEPAVPEFAAIVPLGNAARFGETLLAAVQRLLGMARMQQLRQGPDDAVELALKTREVGGRALHCVALRSPDSAGPGTLIDNFSPCLVILDDHAVLSSTTALAERLIRDLRGLPGRRDGPAGAPSARERPTTDSVSLDCVELLRVLEDHDGPRAGDDDGSRAAARFLELFKRLRLTSVRDGDLVRLSLELSIGA